MNKTYYIIAVLLLFIFGCAQVGSLTGGKKDTDPPVLLKSTPENKSLNFKGKKLTFKFDEYFILNDLNSVFISSPPFSEKPDFTVKGKKFIVKFNEKLKDSTTYMFWFADALQDNNEKNPYKDFKFVFSTSNEIDTMEISGVVKDAFSNKPDEEMYVLLYKTYADSTPINQKPYYIAKTDTSGKFKLDYLKTGKYKIFALKDLDANLQFTLPNEKIAFLDSLLVPSVKTETKIDTFKAGSILQIGTDTKGDTLLNDTVIMHEEYIYSPKNITLFSFEEDNNKQYILNSSRDVKGKCKFEFNKKTDSTIIKPLNFKLYSNDYLIEKVDTGKSIVYWFKNDNIFNKDTLSFLASYFNKDSVDNIVKESDTIIFPFDFEKDTISHFVDFIELKTQQDSFENYLIETNTPINKFDTSKIHFFEILDTLVADVREQKLIKFQRPNPNELDFEIKRPFVNDFFIECLNNDSIENWYSKTYSADSTKMTCEITNKTVSQKDTIKVILHYDNKFFKGQIQNMADTMLMPLNRQSVVYAKRPATDTVEILFRKKISEETKIFIDENSKWYKKIPSEKDNVFKLKIKEKQIEDKDTIILTVKTKEYENTKEANKVEIEYLTKAIFNFDEQKIKKYAREERNRFYFIFSKPLQNNVFIKPLNFKPKASWYKKEINENKDTVVYTISSRTVSSIDTIKLEVKYDIKNRFKEIEHVTDTVGFVYKRVRERHKRTAKNNKKVENKKEVSKQNNVEKSKVGIEIPIKYDIVKDTTSERRVHISYPWKTDKSYVLKMDSTAFIDIYNNYSKENKTNFNINKASSYCELKIAISNINNISKLEVDTTNVDSLMLSNLEKGQILLSLYDEKNNIIKTNITSSDTLFTVKKLNPGKYSLKIIYDENMNKKWDTGKYIKHIQPEKVIIYSEELNLSEGEKKEIEWNLE